MEKKICYAIRKSEKGSPERKDEDEEDAVEDSGV